jgi:hypothetical protein
MFECFIFIMLWLTFKVLYSQQLKKKERKKGNKCSFIGNNNFLISYCDCVMLHWSQTVTDAKRDSIWDTWTRSNQSGHVHGFPVSRGIRLKAKYLSLFSGSLWGGICMLPAVGTYLNILKTACNINICICIKLKISAYYSQHTRNMSHIGYRTVRKYIIFRIKMAEKNMWVNLNNCRWCDHR